MTNLRIKLASSRFRSLLEGRTQRKMDRYHPNNLHLTFWNRIIKIISEFFYFRHVYAYKYKIIILVIKHVARKKDISINTLRVSQVVSHHHTFT